MLRYDVNIYGANVLHDLTGKTAVITGGAGSIGSATAKLLLEYGASVVLVDRDADALAHITDNLKSSGQIASYVAVYLTKSKPQGY